MGASAPVTLEAISAQVAAVSLKLDRHDAGQEEREKRIGGLEIVLAAILQALRHEQMAALGTMIEKLDKLQDAATDGRAGGELAQAIARFAYTLNELVGSNLALTKAVREFPEMVALASGGGIDLPDAEREPAPAPAGAG